MLKRVRRTRYDRVYDLQTSSRSSTYFQLLRPKPPEWSGVAPGCSHPHRNPGRDEMHTLERQAEQLRDAGIWPDAPVEPGQAPPPDLSWLARPEAAEAFGLGPRYVLLVPGGSAHRPEKRWPLECYAELARLLGEQALSVGVIGGPAEAKLAHHIMEAAPGARDLTGRTDFAQIAALGVGAALAVGNDTGPTHLLAVAGCPTLALFGADSDPALCAPRGPAAAVLRHIPLAALGVRAVQAALAALPARG